MEEDTIKKDATAFRSSHVLKIPAKRFVKKKYIYKRQKYVDFYISNNSFQTLLIQIL